MKQHESSSGSVVNAVNSDSRGADNTCGARAAPPRRVSGASVSNSHRRLSALEHLWFFDSDLGISIEGSFGDRWNGVTASIISGHQLSENNPLVVFSYGNNGSSCFHMLSVPQIAVAVVFT